jgi:hypothetical protein
VAKRKRGPSRPRPASNGRAPKPAAQRTADVRPRPGRSWRRFAAIVIALLAAYVLVIRAKPPGTPSPAALAAATAAGWQGFERPVVANPSREHLSPGQAHVYPDRPAAAGPHDPQPLDPDPHIHTEPIAETRAVHNLEHAYVLIYYRPSAEGGPSADVTDRLAAIANEDDRVIMAPYPDLPDGTGLALLAWNTRWLCPGTITADQAATIATSFVDAYRGTTNAPEAPRGLLGPLYTK